MSSNEEQDRIDVSGSGSASIGGGVSAGAGGVAVGDNVQGGIQLPGRRETDDDKEND